MSANTTSNKVEPFYVVYREVFTPLWHEQLETNDPLWIQVNNITFLDYLLRIDERILEAICLHTGKMK